MSKHCTKCDKQEQLVGRTRLCGGCHSSLIQALGGAPDKEVARVFGLHKETVRATRVRLGVASYRDQRVSVVGSTKVCTKCGERKEFHLFPTAVSKSRSGRAAECTSCKKLRVYHSNKRYYKENRSEILSKCRENESRRIKAARYARQKREILYRVVEEVKKAPCVRCGQHFPYWVMDFDHRDPASKKDSVNRLVGAGVSVETLLSEISKCDLLCACCHRLKSWEDRTKNAETRVSYKRMILRELKKKNPCCDCGENFHYSQMDLDHVRGVKVGEVSRLSGSSLELLMREVAKCEIVCANCHRTRTKKEPKGNRRGVTYA